MTDKLTPAFGEYTATEIAAAEKSSAEAALIAPTTEKESPHFFYTCAHGSSNTPCPVCFADLWKFAGWRDDGTPDLQPVAGAVKPDDWQATYVPPGLPGANDATNLAP